MVDVDALGVSAGQVCRSTGVDHLARPADTRLIGVATVEINIAPIHLHAQEHPS